MAALADQDRFDAWADLMREMSGRYEVVAIAKADLRAAINAADDWVNANAASFNTALPQPARSSLTASQKALLLQYVVAKRYQTGV